MPKVFNVTGDCKPNKHYMVNLDTRLAAIKTMVDDGAYFTINRARQYGKTTTLRRLSQYLQEDYYVVFMDFQNFGEMEFKDEITFTLSFAEEFLSILKLNSNQSNDAIKSLEDMINYTPNLCNLRRLFLKLNQICEFTDKPIVLIIDEVDSASNNRVFLDFLAQLRARYLNRDIQATFHSVILSGVYDIKNLKRKLRPEDSHKVNSPWNIATDFTVDMSFSANEIAQMLSDYEQDYHTGMDTSHIARLIYDYTSGYPFLVSRLCKYIDEVIWKEEKFVTKALAWTKAGFQEAVKLLLNAQNTLFESLSGKLIDYPELNQMLRSLLFTGKAISYNFYEPSINIATMFGFVKNNNGTLMVANRIFETWLYNLFLSSAKIQNEMIYTASLRDKNQFIVDGHLDMKRILERFVVHFNNLYGDSTETFLEEEGRKYFLLYLRPIINGVGNYYIESRTRELRRTDIIVDYLGEQYIIEMKIWHGNEYNSRGEQQLIGYLKDYEQAKGYMVSFNFNKKKTIGVHEIVIGDKTIIEAVV